VQFVEATEPSTDTSWQGNCYLNAIQFVIKYDEEDYKVCHGIVRGQGRIDGNYISHAWVEDHTHCYDTDARTNNVCKISKILYYAIGNIKPSEVRRYNRVEVFENISKVDNAGPWDEKLIHHALNEEGSVYEIS